MKKVLFSLFAAGALFNAQAQTIYFEENFDNLTALPDGWQNIDADGDTYTWNIVQIVDTESAPVFTPLLRSASWAAGGVGALKPDNWVITPGIDLSAAMEGEEVFLTYDINAVDKDWDAENYTVYVGTSSNPDDLKNAAISFNESTLDGFNEFNEASQRSVDVSALAGEMIYVAFRHHDVTDQFTMELDNIKVASGSLAVSDVEGDDAKGAVSLYPNPAKDVVKVAFGSDFDSNKVQITLSNMAGQVVSKSAYNAKGLNVANLPAGVYVLTVTDGKNTQSQKLIKK